MTALLGTIGLVVIAVVAVGYPLVYGARRRAMPVVEGERQRAELEARREALYAALKDLEFDHETGKLSAEDYAVLRERYTVQAVTVLQQLDALATEGPSVVGQGDAAPDEELEREVAVAPLACPVCRRAYRPGDVFCAGCGASLAEVGEGRCPECGAEYAAGDRFCVRCGAALAVAARKGNSSS